METSKQIFEKEKREQRAKDVDVKLASTSTRGFFFNVYGPEEKVKYIGEISKDHVYDECGCESFLKGNSEDYQKTHPLPFQCKHIIKAHSIMEGYW